MEKEKAIWSADPKDYVKWWLEDKGFIAGKTGIFSNGKEEMRIDQLNTRIFVDYHIDHTDVVQEIKKRNKKLVASDKLAIPPYKKKDLLHAAVAVIIMEEDKRRLNEIKLKLKHDPEIDPNFKQARVFIDNITSVSVNLGVAVLLHFIWLVKRKMFGKEAEHHLVPVLMGPGGRGKSKNLERFLAPLSDFVLEINSASQLTDVSSFQSFENNYVAVLDEFAKMDKQDFNQIKQFITAPTLSSRTLYTNTVTSSRQNITLCATSNYPINEQIFESAGMRRFYEYKVDKSINKEVSMGIDYLAMWKSVNEDAPSPIIPHLAALAEHQESIRTPDPIELFFEEFCIDPTKPLTFRVENKEGMYKRFKNWALDAGFDAPWMKKESYIKTKLTNRGLEQRKVHGKIFWYVNEDCKLNPLYEHSILPKMFSEKGLMECKNLPELEQRLAEAVKNQDYTLAAGIQRRIADIQNKNGGIDGFLLNI